jgi:hypothetical protein
MNTDQLKARYVVVMLQIEKRIADVRSYVPKELADEREQLERVLGIE